MTAATVRPDRQRGAAAVEAALLLPLLVLLLLAAVDVGFWVFETTQASSAARDGARVAILAYNQADVVGSADQVAVLTAVKRRIGNKAVAVEIRCMGPASTTVLACVGATPVNLDRIRVKVTWPRRALGYATRPFGLTQTVTSEAVMSVNGRPSGVVL